MDALVAEAMRSSPAIAAAREHWHAATKVPIQEATLPDPQIGLQEFTVGSPAPASGYETSDFYYTGLGVSQDIPGPGKLRLRAARAQKDADYSRASLDAAERRVAEKVREDALNLFFLSRARDLLLTTRAELARIERITETQYRTGRGQQQDVIRAQLEMTSILRELENNSNDLAGAQANLKAMLGRDQDSPRIIVAEVTPTAPKLDDARLRAAAASGSAEVAMAQAARARSEDALELARHDYWPDFSVGYVYQKTGPGFSDYYMLTLGAKIPLYFWRKQTPAVEQAAAEKWAASSELRSIRLETTADLQTQLSALRTQTRIIALYKDGLIPQAQAAVASSEGAYRAAKVDFQTLMSAVVELLDLRIGYYRAIADHEIAIAKITQIIGERP